MNKGIENIVEEMLDDYKIDRQSLSLLIDRVGGIEAISLAVYPFLLNSFAWYIIRNWFASIIIILIGSSFLLSISWYDSTGTTKKSTIIQNTDLLLSYIEHPNPDTILIFSIVTEKLDERKKITKGIKKAGTVIEVS